MLLTNEKYENVYWTLDFVVCFLLKRYMKTLVFLGPIYVQRFLAR